MKEIEAGGILFNIRSNARARQILITVHQDGTVIVTKPTRVSMDKISKLLEDKIAWTKDQITRQRSKPQKLLGQYSVKDFRENKEKARAIAHERLKHFNEFYKLKIGKIYIRNQKSRWGSCSGKGNLNFNYKIAVLPSELADYIIVHELCHLKEMNHSNRFWELVRQQIPDYKELRRKIQIF